MKAYVPDWFYIESRDFMAKKDEKYGVKTRECVKELDITKITPTTIFGTDKWGVKTSVKKSMARKSRKGCYKLLRELNKTHDYFCYA